MLFLFSITLPNEKIMQALTWTFIHSLWQGTVLSIVAAGILFCTKKATAALRYKLLTAALFLFLLLMANTFNKQLVMANQVAPISKIIPITNVSSSTVTGSVLQHDNDLTLTSKATLFIANNANWIMLFWFMMIAYQFMRLAIGLYKVAYIKKTKIFPAGEYWNNRLLLLQKQLQISTPVRLLQSEMAQIPVAIGFLKPVILFPVAMFASLPVNEIEAILLHELAHIRRKDFLVNLLQSIIEILFFFNPAVLWVSTLIKIERENCCDDIVINHTGNKQSYINALLSFQLYDLSSEASLTAAFTGEKKYLLNRIKRIIYNNNKTLSNMEKKFLAAGIILTSACFFTFSTSNAQKKKVEEKVSEAKANSQKVKNGEKQATSDLSSLQTSDTDNVFKGTINTTIHGKKYRVKINNNQISELYVDEQKIAAEKIGDYKKITDEMMRQAKVDMEQSRKDLAQSKIDLEQAKKDMEQSSMDMERSKIDQQQSQEDLEQSKKDMEQSKKDLEQSKKDMEQSKKDMEQSKKDMEQSKRAMEQYKKELEQSKKDRKQSKKDLEQSKKDAETAMKDAQTANIDSETSKKDSEQSRILQENIIQDLINEHIINSKQELISYKLDNTSLIVNGVKQLEAMHKKLKSKYGNGDKWSMMYNSANDLQ